MQTQFVSRLRYSLPCKLEIHSWSVYSNFNTSVSELDFPPLQEVVCLKQKLNTIVYCPGGKGQHLLPGKAWI